MIRSGYPRLAKEWKRGTPLSDAKRAADSTRAAFRDALGDEFLWEHVNARPSSN